MNPKSLVVFCPNCCRTYEKRGLHVGDIRCDECSNHGDQLVVEVRRYEDVAAGAGDVEYCMRAPMPVDMPSGARSVLETVRSEPGLSSGMIALRLGYTQQYVARMLRRLSNANYVVCRDNPFDARIKLYYPAEARP